MQKARVKFNKTTTLNDGLIINRSTSSNNHDAVDFYIAFFNNSEVFLYTEKSQFLTKINSDELENLIQDGSIQVVP